MMTPTSSKLSSPASLWDFLFRFFLDTCRTWYTATNKHQGCLLNQYLPCITKLVLGGHTTGILECRKSAVGFCAWIHFNQHYTLQSTFTDTSTPKRAKQSSNYFGKRVSVLFDDRKKYVGVIISKGLKSGQWITHFEDGSEDKCADVAKSPLASLPLKPYLTP